jgi:hypothetical protein
MTMTDRKMPSEVKRSIERQLRVTLGGHSWTVYVTPQFEGRKSAAWAADSYKVFVINPNGDAPLEAAAEVLRAVPGCREVRVRTTADVAAEGKANPVRWGVYAWLDPDGCGVTPAVAEDDVDPESEEGRRLIEQAVEFDRIKRHWLAAGEAARAEFLAWLSEGGKSATPAVARWRWDCADPDCEWYADQDYFADGECPECASDLVLTSGSVTPAVAPLRLCACGCGQPVSSPRPEARYATPACRVLAHWSR